MTFKYDHSRSFQDYNFIQLKIKQFLFETFVRIMSNEQIFFRDI